MLTSVDSLLHKEACGIERDGVRCVAVSIVAFDSCLAISSSIASIWVSD